MKKVNVLLSTYNGMPYLKEQLDSLIAQSYKLMFIYTMMVLQMQHTVFYKITLEKIMMV